MSVTISRITDIDIRLVPGGWPMPRSLRDRVSDVWAQTKALKPNTWDGRILGFTKPVIGHDGVLRAEAREDAYSAFLTWRESGFPDIGMVHLFGTALIQSSDGAVIYGVMGGDTLNAGRVYPPGGSLEPRDVRNDGRVDVHASIATELWEETGLHALDAVEGPLLAVHDGPRFCVSRLLKFDMGSSALVSKIRANLKAQAKPELADVVACRSIKDAEDAGELVPYAAALLDYVRSIGTVAGVVP